MILKARNKDLVNSREFSTLTIAASAGASGITVEDNNGLSNADLLIIGQLGSESSELIKITSSVTVGQNLSINGTPTAYNTGLIFAHPAGTPIYRIPFDQVEYSYASTLTGSKTVLTTSNVQPDDFYTNYDDTAHTSGFAFFRFKNSVTGAFSEYSDGVLYTGYTDRSLNKLRKRTRRYLSDRNGSTDAFFTDEEIDDAIYDSQLEISAELNFPFAEAKYSFASVANQYEYDLTTFVDTSSNVLYRGALYDVTVRTQPLIIIDEKLFNTLNWDGSFSGRVTHGYVRNHKLVIWPKVSSSAQTTALNGAITSTDTTITVDSTSGFPGQGRIIIDSEVIDYTATTTTTFTGCTRAIEGTTAAAHSDDATVTNRDIILTMYVMPSRLVAETDETPIQSPDLVAINAALILSFLRMPDDKGFIDRLQLRRDRLLALAQSSLGNQYAGNFSRVKRKFEVIKQRGGLWPSVLNPRDLTGT